MKKLVLDHGTITCYISQKTFDNYVALIAAWDNYKKAIHESDWYDTDIAMFQMLEAENRFEKGNWEP